jgi:hypothetical protein
MDGRNRVKVSIEFTVVEETVPGLFYDPQDFVDLLKEDIAHRLQAYEPEIVSSNVEPVVK